MRRFVLTVGLQYFTRHGCLVIVLSFGARLHRSFTDYMFYTLLCSQSAETKTTTTSMCYLLYALLIITK